MLDPVVLDLSDFDGPGRLEFADKALEGFKRDGFIKIVGHGIPASDIKQLLAWVSDRHFLPISS